MRVEFKTSDVVATVAQPKSKPTHSKKSEEKRETPDEWMEIEEIFTSSDAVDFRPPSASTYRVVENKRRDKTSNRPSGNIIILERMPPPGKTPLPISNMFDGLDGKHSDEVTCTPGEELEPPSIVKHFIQESQHISPPLRPDTTARDSRISDGVIVVPPSKKSKNSTQVSPTLRNNEQ
jgi:hypothetical protein